MSRTTQPYLARRFYRNVFCLFVSRTERREPPDRWQLSVSRREKEEEPIFVMIFFSSHLLFETCKDSATANEYQLHPASLFASCMSIKRKKKEEKKRNRPDSPSSAFSSSRQRSKRNAKNEFDVNDHDARFCTRIHGIGIGYAIVA